jgi:hypothetical protein
LIIPLPLPTRTFPPPAIPVWIGKVFVGAVENADETKTEEEEVEDEDEADGAKSKTVAKSPTLPLLFPATATTLLELLAKFA